MSVATCHETPQLPRESITNCSPSPLYALPSPPDQKMRSDAEPWLRLTAAKNLKSDIMGGVEHRRPPGLREPTKVTQKTKVSQKCGHCYTLHSPSHPYPSTPRHLKPTLGNPPPLNNLSLRSLPYRCRETKQLGNSRNATKTR